MTIKIRTTVTLIIFHALGMVAVFAQSTNGTSESAIEYTSRVKQECAFAETNKAMDSLLPISVDLNNIERVKFNDRASKTEFYLGALAWIDENTIVITNVYSWNIVPPPDGEHGPQYSSGVAASTLKDPVARAKYEAALKVNSEGIKATNFQARLGGLNEQISFSFENYLTDAYTASSKDKTELEELLNKAKLTPKRKASIEKLETSLRGAGKAEK